MRQAEAANRPLVRTNNGQVISVCKAHYFGPMSMAIAQRRSRRSDVSDKRRNLHFAFGRLLSCVPKALCFERLKVRIPHSESDSTGTTVELGVFIVAFRLGRRHSQDFRFGND